MSSDRKKIPMAFIGGPLNLHAIPDELVFTERYYAPVLGSLQRTEYRSITYSQGAMADEEFIFFVDYGSTTKDEAETIIRQNFFRSDTFTISNFMTAMSNVQKEANEAGKDISVKYL